RPDRKIMKRAIVLKYHPGPNPATWKGNLECLLPARRKVHKVEHHPALPYKAHPEFMRDLRQQFGVAALALEFTILTGPRTGEVIGATWDEMDLGDKVWTIPAGRMKKNDEKHRVPMCDRAVVILKEMHAETIGPYVFPGLKRGKPLSNMAMAMTLERMGRG